MKLRLLNTYFGATNVDGFYQGPRLGGRGRRLRGGNGTATPGSQSPGGRNMGGKINIEIKNLIFRAQQISSD
jgi:hypothetical protein